MATATASLARQVLVTCPLCYRKVDRLVQDNRSPRPEGAEVKIGCIWCVAKHPEKSK